MAYKKPDNLIPFDTPNVNLDDIDMVATLTNMIEAWAHYAPHKKFAGMSLDDFKKSVQPCFEAHAEVAMVEREIARLRAALGEADPSESTVQ
jgi:hypothetical protein